MTARSRGILIGSLTTLVFVIAVCALGAIVLTVVLAYLIGPHGAGLLPEWLDIPALLIGAAAVGYASFKVSSWTQKTLVRRLGATK